MIGDALHRLACRTLRPETRYRIVEPAIADLQHEAPRGRIWRVRGYIGVWRAVAFAIGDDLLFDTSSVIRGIVTPMALRPALATGALVSVALMLPPAWAMARFHASGWVLMPLLAVSVIPLGTLPALAVAARAAARGNQATRGFVMAGAIAGALLLLYIDQGVTRTNRLFREIEGRAQGIENPAPGARELSLVELRDYDPAGHWYGHENEFAREGPQRIGFAASAVAYVLAGVALGGIRTWIVPVAVFAWSVAHYALMLGAFMVSSRRPELTVVISFAPVVALTAAAGLAAKYRARLG
jgi:hypothetical protein